MLLWQNVSRRVASRCPHLQIRLDAGWEKDTQRSTKPAQSFRWEVLRVIDSKPAAIRDQHFANGSECNARQLFIASLVLQPNQTPV